MSLSFPASPSVGQIYQGWKWNGSAWDPNLAAVLVGSFNGRSGAVTFDPTDNTTGNRVFISSQTIPAAVAQVNLLNVFSAAYRDYEIVLRSLIFTAPGAGAYLAMRFSTNGGATWDMQANYAFGLWYAQSANAAYYGSQVSGGGGVGGGVGSVQLSVGLTGGLPYGFDGTVAIFDPRSAQSVKRFWYDTIPHNSTNGVGRVTGGGAYYNAAAVDSVALLPSSGNIAGGIIEVYGIAK